jgi:glutamate dehydrogenase
MMAAMDVSDRVDERLAGERADALRAFATAYTRRLAPDGDGLREDDLLAELLGAFRFASARGARPVAVRAFNPTRERDGYEPLGSVVETNTEDWPFLVDSVSAELEARGLRVVRLVHPVIGIARDGAGRIARVQHPRHAPERESVMHFDLERRLAPEALAEVEAGVRAVLEAVRAAVTDFGAMTRRVEAMQAAVRDAGARFDLDERREAEEFLAWLLRGNFVLLGAREYDYTGGTISVVAGSGLGILADERRSCYHRPVAVTDLPEAIRRRALEGDLLLVDKTNARSPVHRRERMEYVGVRRVGPGGEIAGESRLLGLFTHKAYAEPASETPVLRRKLRQLVEAEDLIEGSHDYKAAVALFDSFPKEELFAAPVEDLRRAVVALLALEGTERVRLLARRSPDGRSAGLILALPRERYDPALVDRVQARFSERFGTADVEAHHVLGEGSRARVHFTVHADAGLPELAAAELEREVLALARTWDDALRDVLAARHGPGRGRALAEAAAHLLPAHYKGYTAPETAARDVERLSHLGDERSVVVSLQPLEAGPTRVALYKRGRKIELSQAMPMLEDLGLRVIEEISTRLLEPAEAWVQEFRVLGPDGAPLDLDAAGERVAETIAAVYRGDAESDSLNRLVITAGLDRRQLAVVRAWRKYRQRVGSRFTEGYQNDVLVANSALTAQLVRYFELRFDPARETDEAAEQALRAEILAGLEDVVSLDHDRILRNQLGLIDAMLRTNAYKPERGALAFKVRSADVPAMPQPAPVFEIYVYGPEMEGIHLRGGRIARGGLRHSDRMDYRTEVYGLMRAQLTKNAIIVPAGAKGGFVVKVPVAGRADVERHYATYIRVLLDLTDNLVDGEVVHPPHVRIRDEDDTYLVVAADKGTATFSDLANRVAREYRFWLDDAFASGGSAGYDHKGLGITARGAWESVKRHFSQLGLDPARDPFTVVGIGDMSGDVFGNGMLLSDRIRLVGAYDHRHVFLDPDPDPARGFAERSRLFALPGSSWDDYDRAAISEGGGVWPRTAKSIPLSPQAREALGVSEAALPPNEVIRAILRARVDLLWNGGIGTVVKASGETDADAHDRASDPIRVDADQLRARVVAEGGNLGLTRRARVEYAALGGLINADFIDNSAGVDCSDHEVNLKILLGLAERRGDMTRAERDELLVAVTDDVVAHVLYDSFLQAQIIAQEVERSPQRLYAYEDLMGMLEESGLLDRASEDLPTAEVIAERRREGRGMERPELAVLVAYAKRWVARALERSSFVEEPWLERDLREYFPPAVVARCGDLLAEHPLRRELICMANANSVVNALGPTFVSQLVAERGAEPAEVVRAYRIAREVTDAAARWDVVERLDRVDRAAQAELMAGVDALVEATTRWYLAAEPRAAAGGADLAQAIAAGREGFERLGAVLGELGTEERRRRRRAVAERLAAAGVPEPVARAHALRGELAAAPDVLSIAEATGRGIEDVAAVAFAVGAELRIDWLEAQLDQVRATTRMQRWALQAVREDAREARRDLARQALAEATGAPPQEAVEDFLVTRADGVRRLQAFLRSLSREGDPDLAGLTLAVRQLRALAG